MWLNKANTWALAHQLGGAAFIDFIEPAHHTCYLGDRSEWHAWGYGYGDLQRANFARGDTKNMWP